MNANKASVVLRQGQETGQRRHGPIVAQLLMAAVIMFGFGYLMVPLYRIVCTALGVNGALPLVQAKTPEERVSAAAATGRELVTVRFLADLPQGGLFDFKAMNQELKIVPGKIYEVRYVVHNKESRAVTAQAVVSIQPGAAARHIHKIECFCFTRQHFAAGETREMPVRFYFDQGLARSVQSVSLSYALYRLDDQA